MTIFSDETFRSFLGQPLETQHDWGREWRFSISRATLEKYRDMLRDTIYHHHAFFDLHKEIEELGFVLSAHAMKDRYSGNPKDHNTRMGNLGEVLGSHLVSAHLSFCGRPIYPKRYNTNVEQAQKGIDVLGFKDILSPAGLLIGEVKARIDFDQGAIREDYETLCKHQRIEDLAKIFHFARAYFRDDKEHMKNIERHSLSSTLVQYLLLSVTESRPRQPFAEISQYSQQFGAIVNLLAVHIEIKGLGENLPILYE